MISGGSDKEPEPDGVSSFHLPCVYHLRFPFGRGRRFQLDPRAGFGRFAGINLVTLQQFLSISGFIEKTRGGFMIILTTCIQSAITTTHTHRTNLKKWPETPCSALLSCTGNQNGDATFWTRDKKHLQDKHPVGVTTSSAKCPRAMYQEIKRPCMEKTTHFVGKIRRHRYWAAGATQQCARGLVGKERYARRQPSAVLVAQVTPHVHNGGDAVNTPVTPHGVAALVLQ